MPSPRPAWLLCALALSRPVAAGEDITLDQLRMTPTIRSIGVLVDYSGDDDQDASGQLEYRAAGESAYRQGHRLVRLGGRRLAASVLFLDADTAYEIRAVIDDPDNPAPVTIEGEARTRVDAPQPVAAGRDVHVDAASGSDAAAGSASAPFATIQRAVSVVLPGDRVHVHPGVYREAVAIGRGGEADDPVWLVAEGEGVILDGSDPALETGAAWTDAGGGLYWTGFAETTSYVAVDDVRMYPYASLAGLLAEDGRIGQPGVIAGGFFVDTAADRLYLITPAHDHPAGHAIHVAVKDSALSIGPVAHLLVEGFEIRYYRGAAIDLRSRNTWIRRNRIHHATNGIRAHPAGAAAIVIEGNSFRDTSVYAWPWDSVKPYEVNGKAIEIKDGSGAVVRGNQLEGSFNGIYVGSWDDRDDEDVAPDTDVHDNALRYHGDDAIEVEGATRNGRFFDNLVRDSYHGISTSPVTVGPAFVAYNRVWGYANHAVKLNSTSNGWIFFYHNTALPLPLSLYPKAQALEPDLFGHVTSRNNIWEANRYAIEYEPLMTKPEVSLDRDDLYSHDEGLGATCGGTVPDLRFVKWLNVCYRDLAALQAAELIEPGGFQVEPLYADAAIGDFTLVAGHPLVDAAEPVPGINLERTAGAGPDLGAVERDLEQATADLLPSALRAPRFPRAGVVIAVEESTANRGTSAAAGSSTALLLSTDRSLGPDDVELAARPVGSLDPGASDDAVHDVTLPALEPGTYYLLARADALGAVPERSEGNNVLSQAIGLGPDLLVSAVATAASAGPGLPITVTDTTCNQGAEPAGASVTRFVLSADATLDAGDVWLGSRNLGALPAGSSNSGSSSFVVPPDTPGGTYRVIALADGQGDVGEASESNNQLASAAIAIGPDLVVAALTAPPGGAGYTLLVSDQSANPGSGAALASTTGFFLSLNAALDAGDVALGGRPVPALGPGGTDAATTGVLIPAGTATGVYHVIALADSAGTVGETIESNNTRSATVRIGPDLVVSSLGVPATGGAGSSIAVTSTTANSGGGWAGESRTRFFFSANATLDAGDAVMGERTVPALEPGQPSTQSTALTIPAGTAPGTWWIIAAADATLAVIETFEGNNTRTATIKVGPDLTVSSITVPATAGAGIAVTIRDTTLNLGSAAAASLTRYFLSANNLLDAADLALGERTVPALAAGGSHAGSKLVTIPADTPAGTWFVIAKADAGDTLAELVETNNTRAGSSKIGPDLIVASVSAPSSALRGAIVVVTDKVKNQGGGDAAASRTGIYFSTNSVLDASDLLLGRRDVPPLLKSAVNQGSISVTLPSLPPGPYFIIARADSEAVVGETSEVNNDKARAITLR